MELGQASRKNALRISRIVLPALFLSLFITALPYLTYLVRLPFTRGEMFSLCWFPGGIVTALICDLIGKSTEGNTVEDPAFWRIAEICNVVVYSLLFSIVLWLLGKSKEKKVPARANRV
jgi:hypothetical protein